MTAEGSYPSYRAPQTDGEILCLPPWSTLSRQLATNRQELATSTVEILGVPLVELARSARRELVAQALDHTNRYADVAAPVDENAPLIITGHQPELTHPGVWLKNFAAARLANQTGGTAISLIIDNDLCRTPSLRVPTGSVEEPRIVDLPLDQPLGQMPYEERRIVDPALWKSLGQRVTKAIFPLVSDPLIGQWWPNVVEISSDTPQLGLAIAQARHRLELEWSHPSLEIPQSQVCQTDSFRHFALHLFCEAARLRHDYNSALADYREAHHLRNSAQPLPDLTEIESWTETPFWIWTQADPTRRALFVRQTPTNLLLSDRQQWQATLPRDMPQAALQQLADWESQGIKLRSRALITTLYARLLLADTFIHGIGGAKYDQVTDTLSQRFFEIRPPTFLTLSGTLRLPIEHQSQPPLLLRKLQQTLRELRYHPESHLGDSLADPRVAALVAALVAEKRRWVRTAKTEANAAERHVGIATANESLQPWLESRRQEIETQLQAMGSRIRANQVLESREYAFCLFPRELLRDFLLDFSLEMA